MGGERWVGERQCVGRAAGLGAQGQEGEVADESGGVWVGVENGVIGLVLGAKGRYWLARGWFGWWVVLGGVW